MFASIPVGQTFGSGSNNTPTKKPTSPLHLGGGQNSGSSSSTPVFGSSPTVFGQKPGFGSSSAFGSQPVIWSTTSPTTSAVGVSGSPILSNTTGFGAASFGTTFTGLGGSSSPAFGSTAGFGGSSFGTQNATSGFGVSSSPVFGSTTSNTNAGFGGASFGTQNTRTGFGVSSPPMFGGLNCTGMFGSTASNTTCFGGAQTTSGFGLSTSPVFGSTASNTAGMFGSTASNTTGFVGAQTASGFGVSSFPTLGSTASNTSGFGGFTGFGQQVSPFGVQMSGQSSSGQNQAGRRAMRYRPTTSEDGGKINSISAMASKSHQELRWEDYQRGDKGGSAQTTSTGLGFHRHSSSRSPFSPTTQATTFAPLKQNTNSPFTLSSNSPLVSSFSFQSTTPTFVWGENSLNTRTNSSSTWGKTGPSFNFTTTPSPATTQPPQSQTQNAWLSTTTQPPQTQTNSSTSAQSGPSFNFTDTPTQLPQTQTPWLSTTPSPTTQPPQTQTQSAASSLTVQPCQSGGFENSSTLASYVIPVNPFGNENSPWRRQGHAPPVPYNVGISSLPAAVRITSSLTTSTRHVSLRKMRLPERKQPGDRRVPFFSDHQVFVPRENPRAWLLTSKKC